MSEIPDFPIPTKSSRPPTRFPNISKPEMCGFFSLDQKRIYHNSSLKNLKYLKLPSDTKNLKWDLNIGYPEAFFEKPPSADNEQLDHILNFISQNLELLKNRHPDADRLLKPKFVCFRGLLRLLMCTPYEQQEGWSILVQKYKGSIYLCAHDEKKRDEAEWDKLLCAYGFKFEQFLFTDVPGEETDPSRPCHSAEEFCGMFETTVEGIPLLYGAEMDGIVSRGMVQTLVELRSKEFVEVKVKRQETHPRQTRNFYKFKLIKWWCQSFLVGITRVIFGLRDDKGVVFSIREMSVREMPKLAHEFWNPAVCLTFCKDFLLHVERSMELSTSPEDVFRFSFDPARNMITCRTYFGQNKFKFLPKWYTDAVN